MEKKFFLVFLGFIMVSISLMCSVTGLSYNIKQDTQSATEASVQPTSAEAHTAPPKTETKILAPVSIKQGQAHIIKLSTIDEKNLINWTSSNTDIAQIDSGGRVDAVSEGAATVTATFIDGSKTECSITVTEPEIIREDKHSTRILANLDILNKNKKNTSNKKLYYIKVNRTQNCVTIYTYDKNGKYTVPVRAMVCSTGTDNSTITGTFDIYFKHEWHPLYQEVYGQYVCGITGDYLFHSVPYYTAKPNDLEVEEYNKLGEQASLGCVRMSASDVKWIYDNCPVGTKVTIYDSDNPGPLGKPEAIKITNEKCKWDPTDRSSRNPYNNKKPTIIGAKSCTIKLDDEFYPLRAVTAKDTCSNDITNRIKITGNVVTTRKGTYKLTYYVKDVLHREASVDITVTVK